jgi:hypothetical protein
MFDVSSSLETQCSELKCQSIKSDDEKTDSNEFDYDMDINRISETKYVELKCQSIKSEDEKSDSNEFDYDMDINRISETYNSLYTVPYRKSINLEYENDVLYSIMDCYNQSYTEIDKKAIEAVMQLPLSPNQLILMKKKWNKQLDIDLIKNSHFSKFSNNSKQLSKSSKSLRSFFRKFTKKSKKNQNKFYDDLI